MLSMNVKRFGLRTALGAVALGLGLAGAAAVSTPAQADEWHHGWHGGYGGGYYGGYHGYYGPRVTFGYGYPYYYPRPRVYYPPAYYAPPAYYGAPYGGLSVTVPIR